MDLLKKYDCEAPRYTSYPPVPFWTGAPSFSDWLEHLLDLSSQGESIDLYIHIPFCEKLCYYCGCNREIKKSHQVAHEYVLNLIREWQLYQDKLGQYLKINSIHLGGGTPTFLPPTLLETLLSTFHPYKTSDFIGAIEIDPRTCQQDHLEVIKKHGFKRVSLGIQDFDPTVQAKINRYQPYSLVEQIVNQARAGQEISLNFDLIYGLPAQTVDSVSKTLSLVQQLRPETIAFYSYAHLPQRIRNQKLIDENDLPNSKEKRELYEVGRELLTNMGYLEIGMDHYALEDSYLGRVKKEQNLMRSFMGYTDKKAAITLGLGASAIGQTSKFFVQNPKDSVAYDQMLKENTYQFVNGHRLSAWEEELSSFIQSIMCQGSAALPQLIVENLTVDQKEKLHQMEQDKLLIFAPENKITLSPLGMSLVRPIVMNLDPYMQRGPSAQFSRSI